MRVYEETNTVYCFSGNCATHGHSLDVIEFVQRKEQCSKREAILFCKRLVRQLRKKRKASRAANRCSVGSVATEFGQEYESQSILEGAGFELRKKWAIIAGS